MFNPGQAAKLIRSIETPEPETAAGAFGKAARRQTEAKPR
jgi:hypothetical protein